MAIDGTGVTIIDSTMGVMNGGSLFDLFDGDFKFDDGELYSSGGRIVDPAIPAWTGKFDGNLGYPYPLSAAFAIDIPNNRAFFLSGPTLLVFDLETQAQIAKWNVPGMA